MLAQFRSQKQRVRDAGHAGKLQNFRGRRFVTGDLVRGGAVQPDVISKGKTTMRSALHDDQPAARGDAGSDSELLSLDAFSQRSGVPASLIQAVEREGIRLGRTVDGQERYTAADIDLVRTALRLLEFGLPLGDLLALAREADSAMRGLAERAVELFDEHVRKPIRDTAGDEDRAAVQMVEAFGELLPAVTLLVSNYFRRVLLETAEDHIEEPA
jgi:DNA-binding transcriptional MerR regulator